MGRHPVRGHGDGAAGRGDEDAALLYLALLRGGHGTARSWPRAAVGPRPHRGSGDRLRELGLVAPAERRPPPGGAAPSISAPTWPSGWSTAKAFRPSTRQVEVKLGKPDHPGRGDPAWTTDYLGLPEGVVCLLVCHCVERVQRRFGEAAAPA